MSSAATPELTLHENTKRVLAAIAEEGSADTTEIRDATGLTAQNVGYHTDRLAGLGLIETAGARDVGAPAPANIYRLTDAGEQIAAKVEDPMTRAELEQQVRALQDQVAAMESKTDRLDDRVDGFDDRHAELRSELADILRRAGIGNDR